MIVPSKLLEKAQYAAYTIRPKLQAHLNGYLLPSANPMAQVPWSKPRFLASLQPNYDITQGWRLERCISPVSDCKGGSSEALRKLKHFVEHGLQGYAVQRNKSEIDATSRLSPYLHFGHVSPTTVALAIENAEAPRVDKAAFLDQLITWRELAVNFVRFNANYDNFECAEPWAHRTLAAHAKDDRPLRYSTQQLENAEVHDLLWNAAQRQMMVHGWMHNCMRMYWAKKILEWTRTPAEAYRTAVYLNDKYELDGRDPNGYAGIAWAIVGKFDRPWFDRLIFGQVRYMSAASTGKKFHSKKYIQQNLSENLLREGRN